MVTSQYNLARYLAVNNVPISAQFKGEFNTDTTYSPNDIVVGARGDGYSSTEVLRCLVQTIAGINIDHTVDNAFIGSPPSDDYTQYFEILENNPLDPSLDTGNWVLNR